MAVLVSVIAAWMATRVSAKTHETTSYHAGTDLFMEVNRVFVEHPEVRPYFYDGKELTEGDPNSNRVQAVAELMLDVFEWIWHRREGITEADRQAWADYVGQMFRLSPALRKYHLDHLAWHPTITELYFSETSFTGTTIPRPTTPGPGADAPDKPPGPPAAAGPGTPQEPQS
ncbi:hypothetical protein OIB37_28885 [Streptomyces sp. NBC_00820]|uniref:hypothetical protein n=1 Tax=Streptomyces sp. NBC_00820 TaxID=2975842 RepID=UPI002ED3878B|nr:hypothetical protein OIB37_28885 [Streptomyces sp. NBC_00820]